MDAATLKISRFLIALGIPVVSTQVEHSFLPGVSASEGRLLVDSKQLLSAGDLLHEAGHLAMLSPSERAVCGADFGDDAGNEMGAIAWSYAALVYLDLPPETVFHSQGYKGEAAWLSELFGCGGGIGVPILAWKRLTNTGAGKSYPAISRWLYDGS